MVLALILGVIGLAVSNWLVRREKEQKEAALARVVQEKDRANRNLARAKKAVEKYLAETAGNPTCGLPICRLFASEVNRTLFSAADDGVHGMDPAAASRLVLTAPASVTAGAPLSLTLIVQDAYGNVATGYTGTVRFTSSDLRAKLPASYTFTAANKGKHTFFGLVLKTKGMQTITLIDTLNRSLTASVVVDVL